MGVLSLPDMEIEAPSEIRIGTAASENKITERKGIGVHKEQLARAWDGVRGSVAAYAKKCKGANKKVSAIINSTVLMVVHITKSLRLKVPLYMRIGARTVATTNSRTWPIH